MAKRILTWYVPTPISVGNAQQETYELETGYHLVRVWMHVDGVPTGSNLIIDIDYTFEDATTSIFTTPLPGIQTGSNVGERDFFANPDDLPAGSLVTFNVDQIGSGEGGKNLTVQLELEELEQET